jgi:hypothetical protein
MKKFLFTLLIGLYFLSMLSCSTEQKIRPSNTHKIVKPNKKPYNYPDINSGIYIHKPVKPAKQRKENDYDQNANSTHKPVRQQDQNSGNFPDSPPVKKKRITMLKLVKKAANHYNVKSSLVCAIINQESGWRHRIISPAGAVGLMQIMPATGRSACNLSRNELFNPSKNINCGVYYFKEQLERFNSIKLALCAYNAGPHRIVKYGKCPPFKETQNYHKVILAAYNRGNACNKAPPTFIDDLPLPPSPPDIDLSAKGKADVEFTKNKGMYSSKQWWGLVCKNIDKVYYENIGSTEPAITQKERKLWLKILNVTVKDIHRDELRLKGQKAMSKNRIRNNIKAYCPKTTREQPVEELPVEEQPVEELPVEEQAVEELSLEEQPVEEPTIEEPPVQEPAQIPLSAKKIADDNFKTGGYKKRDWWKLVCKAIDHIYNKKTGKLIASTNSEIEIWKNILGATVNDIHRDELKNKGYDAAMRKSDIKKNITSSCQ